MTTQACIRALVATSALGFGGAVLADATAPSKANRETTPAAASSSTEPQPAPKHGTKAHRRVKKAPSASEAAAKAPKPAREAEQGNNRPTR